MEKLEPSEPTETQLAPAGPAAPLEVEEQAAEELDATAPLPLKSLADMDDEALAKLVEGMMTSLGGGPGTFHADGGYSEPGKEDDVGKQVLMASLRRGFFSNEPVAVGVDGKIDLEYGNRGPQINPIQQWTNSGHLSALYDSTEGPKQERYRALRMWGRLAGPLGEELQTLEDDEDVHSVSAISAGLDTNVDHFSPCAIDCWLKTRRIERAALQDASTRFDTMRWDPSSRIDGKGHGNGIYSPLAKNHTRILILEPGSYGEEIACSLATRPCAGASTGDAAANLSGYEALSYTWGDPSPKFVVQCNERALPIAHNLFFALQQLRHATTRRYLWIDAICINQDDIAERSAQIQHMLEIYQSATRVLVWLGEESETSALAMEAMKQLDQYEVRKGVMFRVHEPSCYEQFKAACDAMSALLERPWFVRSWIRQELTVARDVIVLCGQESVSWYVLKRSAARLGHFKHKLVKESGLPVSGPESTRYDTAISYLKRGWSYGQPVTNLIGSIRSIWYYHTGGLLDLLMAGRHFDATDARDRVYSVLGLGRVPMTTEPLGGQLPRSKDVIPASRVPPSFPVNYARSVSEVYEDTVKYFINRDRNLDILALLLTTRNDRSADDLPSWVPDWRVPAADIAVTKHWDFISHKFAASGLHAEAEPQDHGETGVLRCKGFLIDRLEKRTVYTATVSDMLELAPGVDDGANARHLGDEEAVTGTPPPEEPTLKVKIADPLEDRTRCFETIMSFVCLAPAQAREGDEVAVLYGGKHPFVLRPRGTIKLPDRDELVDDAGPSQLREEYAGNEATEDGSGYLPAFELIGPCIVPNAMFGDIQEQDDVPTTFILI